jgi:hypothetical protein
VSTERVYLVIGADRSVRAARKPRIGLDEVAIAINLTFPNTWGRAVATLNIDVPDFAPTEVEHVEDEDVS